MDHEMDHEMDHDMDHEMDHEWHNVVIKGKLLTNITVQGVGCIALPPRLQKVGWPVVLT